MQPDKSDSRAARVERLLTSRRDVSADKRRRAITACERLLHAGTPITAARVARDAGVSTWLMYNALDVRQALDEARETQRREGFVAQRSPVRSSVSPDSLRTDVALAREENGRLKAELARLQRRFEQQLGVELESASIPEMMERIREVEILNSKLSRQVTTRDEQIIHLEARTRDLENEVEAKTEALRAMMFARNTGSN